jgi:starvation-inducible DNA-binding protein
MDRVVSKEISNALTMLLADVFAIYVKTKNFCWHMTGVHFRDYRKMLCEQSEQLLSIVDPMAERARKVEGTTLRSISHIARLQRIVDNDLHYLPASEMLSELHDDNRQLVSNMRAVHSLCASRGDVATTHLIEIWIDQADGRVWLLNEAGHSDGEEA